MVIYVFKACIIIITKLSLLSSFMENYLDCLSDGDFNYEMIENLTKK
jgi:hypothetical protein